MASHASAKKSIRKTEKQKSINTSRMSRIKTFVKKLDSLLINNGKPEEIKDSFSKMQKELMRGAAKKVIHKNTANRKISRMAAKVKAALSRNS